MKSLLVVYMWPEFTYGFGVSRAFPYACDACVTGAELVYESARASLLAVVS